MQVYTLCPRAPSIWEDEVWTHKAGMTAQAQPHERTNLLGARGSTLQQRPNGGGRGSGMKLCLGLSMEFGVLIGVSAQWNGNRKSQGPEGLGSVCWGCCYQDWTSWLPEVVPAFLSSSSGFTDHRISHAIPRAWLLRAHLPTVPILVWPLASPGTGPVSWLGLFPRTTVPLVPISREMTQLTRQLTQHYAVAPSHRALFPEAELAAGWAAGKGIDSASFVPSIGMREMLTQDGCWPGRGAEGQGLQMQLQHWPRPPAWDLGLYL